MATFANNILSILSATVGDKYYSLDLNYIAGSSPVQFGLNSATEIASQTTTSGSFVNGVLVVPAVDVEGVSYRIELTLASDSPVFLLLHLRSNSAGIEGWEIHSNPFNSFE